MAKVVMLEVDASLPFVKKFEIANKLCYSCQTYSSLNVNFVLI